MSIASDMAAGLLATLGEMGTTCQLEQATGGTYDEGDGAGATATTTSTAYLCTDVLANKQRGRVDGPIGSAEGVVYMEAGTLTVTTRDVLIHSGTRYSITDAQVFRVAGALVAWKLFVRVGAA